MNLKPFLFAAAFLASGSTLAGSAPVAAKAVVGVARGAPVNVIPGCNGGRGVQTVVMTCAPFNKDRSGRTVTVFGCPGPSFMGEFKAAGPTDAPVTVVRMPVRKVVPKNGSFPAYVGTLPHGTSFNLTIVGGQMHFGGYQSIFEYGIPGPTDKIQMNKFDLLCKPAATGGRG